MFSPCRGVPFLKFFDDERSFHSRMIQRKEDGQKMSGRGQKMSVRGQKWPAIKDAFQARPPDNIQSETGKD